MMNEQDEQPVDVPANPGLLEGISRIRIDCEDLELAIEADSALDGMVHLTSAAGSNAPSLIRDGEELILYQRGRFRSGGHPATLFVPEQNCPPIGGSQEKGDLNIERVNAPITLKLGMGDLRVVGGSGELHLESGKGDLIVGNRQGEIDVRLGAGDVNIARCRGVVTLALGKGDALVDSCEGSIEVKTGSGDVAVSDCSGAANVKLGSGDVVVTRPRSMLVTLANGSGDIVIRSGSVAGLLARTGRGDIASSTQLLLIPGLDVREGHEESPVEGTDAENRVTRLLRSKGIEFLAGDKGVRFSTGGLSFEASDAGVRINKGDFGFEASDQGVRVVRGHEPDDVGAFRIESGNGDITIDVPGQLPMRIEALVNGDLRSDIPLVSVGRPGPRGSVQRFVGVTDPQATERLNLRLKADRGDIRIRAMASIPTPPKPPAPPPLPRRIQPIEPGTTWRSERPISPEAPTARIPSREEQMRAVLDALARGEISVTEADRRIAEIERS